MKHFDYTQCKQRGFAPILVILGIFAVTLIAGGTYYVGTKKAEQLPPSSMPNSISTPTQVIPTTSKQDATKSASEEIKTWKIYEQPNKFSFEYPEGWIQKGSNFIFQEGDRTYQLTIASSGRGGPEADEIKEENKTVNGMSFVKKTWIKNGKPFYISFAGTEEGADKYFNHIEINLPATNTDKYTQIFDKIINSFKFSKT